MASIASVRGARARVRQSAELDTYMLIIAAVLTTFGLVAIWSADGAGAITLGSNVARQAIFAAVGVAAMTALSTVNYRFLKAFAIAIYLATLGILAIVPIVGTNIGQSVRWIYIGPIGFQPSEFAKLGVVIALAAFLSERHHEMDKFHNFLLSLAIVGVPTALVYLQPDLGTSAVFGAIWLAMMVVSRTRMIYLVGMFLLAAPAALFAWHFVMLDYMKDRMMISFDPQRDYFGDGFNIVQARVTIGTSGWFGHGLTGGAMGEYQFLRVRTTDFIFAHAMSMFGFVGGLALFLAFIMLFMRMTRAAAVSRDNFGQYIAIGILSMFVFQTFVNIGMNVGLMPVTGIPLPLISLGGSSLVTNLMSIGILQSIVVHHRRLAFQSMRI
ncbi:FtsW/RodA/SpoVE family cell cycle protein [soil metagenome]